MKLSKVIISVMPAMTQLILGSPVILYNKAKEKISKRFRQKYN